jgi:voltage-gated potassium channel
MNERGNEHPSHEPRRGLGWREHWHEIIFEADTPAGKAFDVALLVAILLSVGAVLLESVADFRARWGGMLRVIEWFFTILFTFEYAARLAVVKRPVVYARSFFGVVDLVALLPSYLSLIAIGGHSLLVIRALRLLRVFRVLKLAHFVGEAQLLRTALRASAHKIIIFVGTVLNLVLIIGSLMYLVEGEAGGFTSIPKAIYWAIVTLTTVGYGDIAPTTTLGQFLAATVMILGYGIIAVPTGIVSVELANASRLPISTQACDTCGLNEHDYDARFCKRCGFSLRVAG